MNFKIRILAGVVLFSINNWQGALAATIAWDESINGSFSNIDSSPTSLNLLPGVNRVIGTIGNGTGVDYLKFSVTGFEKIQSIYLNSYISTDAVSWTGLQAGPSWSAGYDTTQMIAQQHFGTSNLNSNILNVSPTNSLSNGTFTMRVQQLGGATSYQIDLTLVPEPSGLSLFVMSGLIFVAFSRRRKS